ncbi:30S ribosomal protein S13 [bacterium]|nr:30S ribosomal protein S13 [Candidatus Elulimicrobium humile]
MVRIAGVVIPDYKNVEIALTYIYGVGLTRSQKVLSITGIDPYKKAKNLDEKEIALLKECIERNYKIEGDLRREVANNIKRLKDINSYRGSRHTKKLPIKGRTKTNSRTIRGNVVRTMGSGRRKVEKT